MIRPLVLPCGALLVAHYENFDSVWLKTVYVTGEKTHLAAAAQLSWRETPGEWRSRDTR